jgi:hypothetical protein
LLFTEADVYVDQATYDAAHDIELTPTTPVLVEDGYQYAAYLTAEQGELGVDAYQLQAVLAMQAAVRFSTLSPFGP